MCSQGWPKTSAPDAWDDMPIALPNDFLALLLTLSKIFTLLHILFSSLFPFFLIQGVAWAVERNRHRWPTPLLSCLRWPLLLILCISRLCVSCMVNMGTTLLLSQNDGSSNYNTVKSELAAVIQLNKGFSQTYLEMVGTEAGLFSMQRLCCSNESHLSSHLCWLYHLMSLTLWDRWHIFKTFACYKRIWALLGQMIARIQRKEDQAT